MADITSLLQENRIFTPSPTFIQQASIHSLAEYQRLRQWALSDPDGFWGEMAKELHWFKPWQKVLKWQLPYAKWFLGATTNITYNCLDRHLANRGNHPAIIWEGEPGEQRTLTFKELHAQVCRCANLLLQLGIQAGDRVILYMPLIPELAIATLACARIGAVHSVIFGGFSAEAVRGRVLDSQAKLVITADGGWRRGKIVDLKSNVDMALEKIDCVERVLVVRRTNHPVTWNAQRDLWWDQAMEKHSDHNPAAQLDSEHPLFILYTSGTTGKPKGILHTTGGYMVGAYLTSKWVLDLKPNDVYWCTADIGWITGHSYVLYGILLNGNTTLMYEGAPNHPEPDRFWQIIARHRVSIFYTAPTAIRSFIKWGDEWVTKHDLSSLRLLGSVGEPINPEAWVWYHETIGGGRCPIVDTWWQTETGSMMISPLPGVTPTKPGSCTHPLPWVDADIVDHQGRSLPSDQGGFLVIRKPWPSMLRTIYKDNERYEKQYWSEIPGVYFAGDSARRDRDGYFWVMGRCDDVLKISGHRLGTAEIESALVSHSKVAEAAVVGMPDPIKGEGIACFVTLQSGYTGSQHLKDDLKQHVVHEIGALARPDLIRFADALPKTRSGKIMRRLLKDIAAGNDIKQDTTTLEDPAILPSLMRD